MPEQTFELNGKTVTVDTEDEAGLLRAVRDVLGVTGPSTGCGFACDACPTRDRIREAVEAGAGNM